MSSRKVNEETDELKSSQQKPGKRKGEDNKNKKLKERPDKEERCRQNAEGGKDKHFTERGIIMQLFSRVIIGLQAVQFFTEKQQEFRRASKPPTDTYQERSCQPRCYL